MEMGVISNVNVLSENRSVAFLAISGALARGALGGPHTPGQVGVLYGPQTPGQNFQFISHHSSIIPVPTSLFVCKLLPNIWFPVPAVSLKFLVRIYSANMPLTF